MDLINFYIEKWNYLTTQKSDPRTASWFMVDSIIPSALICILYVIYVHIGKFLMSFKKEPFKINNLLIVYNFCMVLLSGYMVYEFLMSGWLFDYSFSCQPVDYSNSPKALRMASVCYVFYMSKFIELCDTLFFILRKKNNQITFLHVFHHGIMPVSWWFGVKFVPGGFGTFHALLNSFIHFLMYFYYGLSACGPQYQKYLWWKKYMTKMQMIQFVLCMIHSGQLLFIKECDYPIIFVYWIALYAVIFLVFFGNFYVQEYIKRNACSTTIAADTNKTKAY